MRGKHTEWNSHVFKVELVGFGGTHPLPLTEILLPLPHFSYILLPVVDRVGMTDPPVRHETGFEVITGTH